MKILAFTAGAAQMYCGSCIRDNALAAELKGQGHDIVLLPIYTPTLTDETNVAAHKVFFGGISVYLEQHSGLFRNTPWLLDKLWDSEWALKLAARRSIPVNPRLLGEMTVSMLRGEDGLQRKEIHKLAAWLRHEPAPDIVTLPNSLLIGLAPAIREAVDRPICCTLQGEDLFLSQLPEPYRTQSLDLIRANIEHVDGFAAVSEYYAGHMCRCLGIPEGKMRVVPLGVNLKGYDATLKLHSNCFTVGYFARVAPEKGLHVLADAYVKLRRETDFGGSALEVAGYLAPEHRTYLHGIERRIKEAGLDHEFRYRGVLDRPHKIDFLRNLDVLSVPATYDEPKGLFLLEAMANGVPVVEPRRGGLTEIVEKTGGGILVEPDDTASLARAIFSLWKDPGLLERLGKRGVAGVREHYSAARMASRALEVYGSIAMQRGSAKAPAR
jgi:glycosyltransferase involved in cell wall biosynthesis